MFKITKSAGTAGVGTAAVDAFIESAAKTPARRPDSSRGCLVFALDATMSRQPTWDLAIGLQSRMFEVTDAIGGLDVQLVYFRGLSECRASPFVSGGAGLARYMRGIRVAGGSTQIGRVLSHVRDVAAERRVGACVFVGDALEEPFAPLGALAGALALCGVKAFMFQEGRSRPVGRAFGEIARITGGAYAAFDASAPDILATLLRAAAVYASSGRPGLEALAAAEPDPQTTRLLAQLR